MKRQLFLAATLALAGCAPGYTSAEFVYAEPAEYTYVVPVDRVVVVTREVLVDRGWVVYRVERSGPNRVVWARRGDDRIVRIVATPHGQRVEVRGLYETRSRKKHDKHDDRGQHRGWERQAPPRDLILAIDMRLRTRVSS